MSIQTILDRMASRAMNAEFYAAINAYYEARHSSNALDSIEQDYADAMARFDCLFNETQKGSLSEIEELYARNRSYAATFGFQCGMYGAFEYQFTQASDVDSGFHKLFCRNLLMQPRMQRHHAYYDRVLKVQALEQALQKTLGESDQKHMVSFGCAWEERIYNAALHGFYCGYQAACTIVECVDPLDQLHNLNKILQIPLL